MIKLQPITTADMKHYHFMEELLVDSFPPEEYRELDELREYTDRKGNFHNNLVFDDDLPIGLLTYWDFDRFCYVEHFAINPALRNGGYGKSALECLCSHIAKPIVLEVERPRRDREMAQRRIGFYQRQGFKLWKKDYHQPPYRPGDKGVPMYLMVHGDLDPEKDYEYIRYTIHTQVYGVRE